MIARYDALRATRELHRRARVGQVVPNPSTQAVAAKQGAVKARLDQIQSVFNACNWPAVRPPFYDQWFIEVLKVDTYINTDPSILDESTMLAQGDALLSELDGWAKDIAARPECANAGPVPRPPTPTPKTPSTGGLFGFLESAQTFELLLGVVAIWWLTKEK